MFRLQGDFGAADFSSSIDSSGRVTSRYLSLNTEASLNFFKKISILKTNITQNSLGLFSFMKAGRNNKVRFAHLSTPKHLFSKRSRGCVWKSKGKISMDSEEISLCPIEYNGEQCPDALLGDCLEGIYGTGNQVRDILATPEGKAFFGQVISNLYDGLGNSFYDLVWYGQHPLIDDADENDWYTVDDKEWEDYIDQQEACGGILTIVDLLKADGLENFNVGINLADISADGESYIGTATDLFDRLIKAQPTEMKMAAKRANSSNRSLKGIMLVDPRIFEKYEAEMIQRWDQLPTSFQYFYNGKFCQAVGCDSATPVPGVLKYKGYTVVCMDEWMDFNQITGTNTFRAMIVAPGNFGLAYDVANLSQFDGMGMRITQHLESPWKGKVFMDTTFKIGMGLVDEKYIVNACRTLVPDA